MFKVKGYHRLINYADLLRIPQMHRSREIKAIDPKTKEMFCMSYHYILRKFK